MSDPRSEIRQLAGDLLVTAGAGAGKTTCLVDTYVSLLNGDWAGEALEPDQIVAITFTEKAAEEMKARVVAKVSEMASQKTGGRDWSGVLAKVEWSFISTIHSFCASLLRDFGAVIGLDPDFSVLDAEAFDELANETAQSMLREMLAQGEPRAQKAARRVPAWQWQRPSVNYFKYLQVALHHGTARGTGPGPHH